jgi:hypothetical protein
MAFALTWKIEFGDVNGLTDITSYVQQMNLDLNADLAIAGRASAQITINNNGGQFTPVSGTYGSTDWFSKAMVITATSGANTGVVFTGMIVDYHITMSSSKESTVTIDCLDALSLAGKSYERNPKTSVVSVVLQRAIEASFNGQLFTDFPGIITPMLGNATYDSQLVVTQANAYTTYIYPQWVDSAFVGDWFNSQMLPCGPAVLIPTDYSKITVGSDPNVWAWNATLIDNELNRTTKTLYELVDGSSTVTTGQIPFSDVNTGFTNDDLTNEINAARSGTGQPTINTRNLPSQLKYGPRTRDYLNLAFQQFGLVDERNFIGDFWTNRYGNIEYLPQEIETSYAVLKGSAVDDGAAMLSFMKLLWPDTALWNRIAVKYKPTGAASTQTLQMIATRRLITADPSNTTIRLTLKSGPNNQSFELDSSTYGILDTNRLA